ncbi:hypothetical protein PanWU01x14_047730, partial [Parasponia andersonii]
MDSEGHIRVVMPCLLLIRAKPGPFPLQRQVQAVVDQPWSWFLARSYLGSEKSSHTRGLNSAKTSNNKGYTSSKLDELELTSRSSELILSIIVWGEFIKNSKSYTIEPDPEVGRTADKGMASYMMSDPDHERGGK